MKIYIVALNEGEWANVAYLCEVTAIAKRTIAKDSRAFKTLEAAQAYAKVWADREGLAVSTTYGSGGITIFSVEMEDEGYKPPTVFNQYELVVWDGADPTHTFNENEVVLFLGEIQQMPGHCVIAKRNGKVVYGFHTDNFRTAREEEL